MKLNLTKVPFSRKGSFITLNLLDTQENRSRDWSKEVSAGLYLRYVKGGDDRIGLLFHLEATYEGQPVAVQYQATPAILEMISGKGSVAFCISGTHQLRIRGIGLGLRMTLLGRTYDNALPLEAGCWEVNSYSEEVRCKLTPLAGKLCVDAPWHAKGCKHVVADWAADAGSDFFEAVIEDYEIVWQPQLCHSSFEACCREAEDDFQQWLNNTPSCEAAYQDARELAAYITWSCMVPVKGHLTRPAMYMSKNWMTNIWSWDNCFNAMALIRTQPELAWDQLMIFVDNQDKSGAFPDFVNDKFRSWSCCKPPIQGWTLQWMLQRGPASFFTPERLLPMYDALDRWTRYWFLHRDDDRDGIPQYNHGNDSGWDNSTVFREGAPVESPDLVAFLILQMNLLADLARRIGKPHSEQMSWEVWRDELQRALLHHFWRKDHFIAYRQCAGSGCEVHQEIASDSLLLYMPLVLGKKLPEAVRESLIHQLKAEGSFLTDYGLATERLDSPYYTTDGYWRGPIWAPSTMLLVDGLAACGERDFAAEIARRFCSMAKTYGMAENYDAKTGQGLRDSAFTWTSSVFLILAHEYC